MFDLIIAANYKVNPKIWGGMDDFFFEVSKEFILKGMKVLIVLPEFKDTDASHYVDKGIPHKVLGGEYYFKELIKFCNANPSRLIHTHFLPTLVKQFRGLASSGTKVITTEHMPRPYAGWSLSKTIKSKLLSILGRNSISRMIHVSKYLENENRLVFGNTISEKSQIIYNGVRLRELNRIPPESFTQQKKLKLVELAEACNMGEATFSRVFKSENNLTAQEYIKTIRISKAKEYLLKTNKTIQQVAYSVGFDNISFFNRMFKSAIGITPTNFRRLE